MFRILIFLVILAVAIAASRPAEEKEEKPRPYEFEFEEKHENNSLVRQEAGDASGTVRGSYTYIDRNGITRTITYVADENGFQADIKPNQLGLES